MEKIYKDILLSNRDNNINLLIYSSSEDILKEVNDCFKEGEYIKKMTKEINTGSKDIVFTLYYSNNIMEINLEEISSKKDILIKNFLKYVSSFSNIDIKKIIINNIHLLSKREQFILRKIIEKSISYKFILLTKNINNLSKPIISRCLNLNIPNRDISIKVLPEILIARDEEIKNIIIEINTYIKNKKKINDKKIIDSINDLYKNYNLPMIVIIKKIYFDFYKYIPSNSYDKFNKILLKFSDRMVVSEKKIYQILAMIYELRYEYNILK